MFAFIGAVLMPIAIAVARRIWRGKRDTGRAIEDRVSPRLDRLEQAVDAIAIEVERISEGQRFVTRVLTERPIPARFAERSGRERRLRGRGAESLYARSAPVRSSRFACPSVRRFGSR
jgi:hypothetical protein